MPTDAAFWDQIAPKYAAQPVKDPAAFDRKIAATLARTRPTDVLLDVGCGTGSLALRLAPSVGEVHGLDVSPEMIRIARGKAEAAGVTNVHFHVGTLEQFDALAAGSVDLVTANSLLHLVEDRADTLARLVRLIRPGGSFVTSTVCLGESWVPYAPLLTVMRWLGKAPAVSIFTKATLEAEQRAAGLADVEAVDVGAAPEIGFWVARKPG